jgi:hypothetical protein
MRTFSLSVYSPADPKGPPLQRGGAPCLDLVLALARRFGNEFGVYAGANEL